VATPKKFGRVLRATIHIDNAAGHLRPSMTGYAEIDGAEMSVWQACSRMIERFFRTEI
jgi:hypothetical protein